MNDLNGMINRMLKYTIEGVVVVFVAHFLPSMKMSTMELATLGLTAAVTFATLDFFAWYTFPCISLALDFREVWVCVKSSAHEALKCIVTRHLYACAFL